MDATPIPESVHTIGGLLEAKAEKLGQDVFFRFKESEYTYNMVEEKANVIARNLRSFGVNEGDIVCLYMYNRPEYLLTLFALSKLGAIAAPIDTRFTDGSLLHIFRETESRILIVDQDTIDEFEEIRDRIKSIEAEFVIDPDSSYPSYWNYDQLLDEEEGIHFDIDTKGSETFSINYVQQYDRNTPQGVMLPHYSNLHTAREFSQNLFRLDSDDCIFATLPFYSCYTIQVGVTGAMLAEAEFAFEKKFQPEQFWERVRTHNATICLYLGRIISVLNNQEEGPEDSNNPAEFAFGYGGGLHQDEKMITHFENRFGITVIEAYGITPNATLATSNRSDERKLGSAGFPVSYVDVEIVDKDDWIVPPGETGEIVIRSDRPNTMMQRFYKDPELTEQVCKNRWIHTNDIGYKDEDGFLYFVMKKSDTIQLRRVAGRISSMEIESVIESHPDIVESVVFGVSNTGGEEAIKAVVVPDPDDLNPIEIHNYCQRRLTYHKLPRYIEIRESIPRSSAGKVRKEALTSTNWDDNVWDRESGYSLRR